jgi:S-adenosylmethionine-dependent methyltransferase
MDNRQDRNFDSLIDRLERVVYATGKGSWRLQLLKEDLNDFTVTTPPLAVWDAGCGFGQISQWLAGCGHRLTLCDLSRRMLHRARASFTEAGLTAEFHKGAFQALAGGLPDYDLVLSHAVLEWLAEPLAGLDAAAAKVKPGGYLSLLFYNRNAVVYKNALRGGWRWQQLLDDSYLGKGNRLTPPNPLYPHEVLQRLQQLGFLVLQQTGIRVFHDYLADEALPITSENQLFELEYRYCRMPVFRDMGRYIHLLAERPE